MNFDFKAFAKAKFTRRLSSVEVPKLKEYFGDKEPVWQIQALSTEDLAIVNLAEEKNAAVGEILKALLGATAKEKGEAVKELAGLSDKLPSDTVKRIEVMLIGSVELEHSNPEHRDIVLKVAQFYPIEFMRITNAIYELSGEGPEVEGKP